VKGRTVNQVHTESAWCSHLDLVCRGPQEACTKGDNHRAEQAIDRGAKGIPGSHGASPACIPRRRGVSFTALWHCMLHSIALYAALNSSTQDKLPQGTAKQQDESVLHQQFMQDEPILHQQFMPSLLLPHLLGNSVEALVMPMKCPVSLATIAVLLCCRPAADAGSSSAPGLAAETILEDEVDQDDVAPTPEQLEVKLMIDIQSTQTAVLSYLFFELLYCRDNPNMVPAASRLSTYSALVMSAADSPEDSAGHLHVCGVQLHTPWAL
jgi:hypothetical protein